MTDRELMQQVLDALEEINKLSVGDNAICLPAEIDTAMDALRGRVEQLKPKHPWVELAQLEPVFDCLRCGHCCPQRKWVGLTDEEKKSAIGSDSYFYSGALWAESKLKEKNT